MSAEPPFPQSQCHGCRHLELVRGARSTFLKCNGQPLKYPPQPVRGCPAFAALEVHGVKATPGR